MSELMDKLASELQSWEQLLEHQGTAAYLKSDDAQESELHRLKAELDIFSGKVRQLVAEADGNWEAAKAALQANLDALDKNIRRRIEKAN